MVEDPVRGIKWDELKKRKFKMSQLVDERKKRDGETARKWRA